LGLSAHSDPWVSRTGPSVSSMIGLCLFFVLGGNQRASKEFGHLASLRYVRNTKR
jgi:hypothetical protein